jgi:uncharacterized DUF497 family protein
MEYSFEWDEQKNLENLLKHGVSFEEAQDAFLDPNLRLIRDLEHSEDEDRWFCLGKVERGIFTVRFTYRGGKIRIFGAGFWRSGRRRYEQKRAS